MADLAMCQIKSHFLETHMTQELFCNLYKRHLSPTHPLYEPMSFHCEGTSPVGALGLGALIDEKRYMHMLFNMGHIGTKKLINKFYLKRTYDDADILQKLKVRNIWSFLKSPIYLKLLNRSELYRKILQNVFKLIFSSQ